MNRFPRLSCASLALAVLLAGCSVLPETQPIELLDPRPQAPEAADRAADWTLALARPETDPARDSARVFVRTADARLQMLDSARWVAATPDLVRTALLRYLRDAALFAQVESGSTGGDRVLMLDLRRFELDESADGALTAVIDLEARLYDARSAERVARRSLRETTSVDAVDAPAVTRGFEDLLGRVAADLAEWLAGQPPPTPTD